MSDLEGSQQSLGKKLMRFESCNVFSIKKNLAPVGCEGARNHVEKGGLTRSVGSDQTGDQTGLDLQADSVNGVNSAELFVNVLNGNHLN